MGVPYFFSQIIGQFISYLVFPLMGRVSWPLFISVFLCSILALWWPNICPKNGVSRLFLKTITSIYLIPCIYIYGMIFLVPIYFCVHALNFGPLAAKCLPENGVPRIILKTISSIHAKPGILLYAASPLTSIHFWNFIVPWPSSVQNNAEIFLRTKKGFPEGIPPL